MPATMNENDSGRANDLGSEFDTNEQTTDCAPLLGAVNQKLSRADLI